MKILEVHSGMPMPDNSGLWEYLEDENWDNNSILEDPDNLFSQYPLLSVNYCSFFGGWYYKFGMLKVLPAIHKYVKELNISERFLVIGWVSMDKNGRDIYTPKIFTPNTYIVDIYCLARPPEQS